MKKFIVVLSLVISLASAAEDKIDYVKVEKSKNLVTLYSNGKSIVSYHAVFGPNPVGHKVKEGDGKTPEGIYTLDRKNGSSGYYKSIHVSYPSASDTENARKLGVSPGGNIMVHGQKNGFSYLSPIVQRFNWTAGCIALSNGDMEQFWNQISVPVKIEIVP